MKVVVHKEAKAELAKSRRWHEKRRAGLGFELQEDVLDSLLRIERDPSIGIFFPNSQYRFCRTNQFPFVIYYLEQNDTVYVMAIAHERRRPGYWMRRKPE
jgi:toxin ParE1/3/4